MKPQTINQENKAAPCRSLLCPSAQPEMAGSMVLGVIAGKDSNARLSYLEQPIPVTDALLKLAHPVEPTQLLRFAAHCEENHCIHYNGKDCTLATRLVQILPAVTEALPPCKIRSECRWFQQEHKAACMRCPQVITSLENPTAEMARAALPSAVG